VILASTKVGYLIIDPFFGTGTTWAGAKKLRRNWVGIEKEQLYIDIALKRINSVEVSGENLSLFTTPSKRDRPKVPFGTLVERELLRVGETLYSQDRAFMAGVCADGSLQANGYRGSIHKIGAVLQGKKTCNGWDFWHCEREGKLVSIDRLRTQYLREYYGLEVETI